MRKGVWIGPVAVVLLLPTWATEPGNPLSSEDWEILDVGLTRGNDKSRNTDDRTSRQFARYSDRVRSV